MEDASGWIIPSLNVHTHPHQAFTWVDQHIMEVVVEAAAAAAVAGDETRIMIVAMIAAMIVDMTSMTTDTAGGALRPPITAATGLAPDLAHTAHDGTKKILMTPSFSCLFASIDTFIKT